MSDLRSTEEPVVRFAKLMAELYYFMAKKMVETLGGQRGKEVIRAAVADFGRARVAAMHREALEKGLDINDLQTFAQIRDLPMIGWRTNPEDANEVTYCPMKDVWSQYGAHDLGALYCEVDYILYAGFAAQLDRPACRTAGDETCVFRKKMRLAKPHQQAGFFLRRPAAPAWSPRTGRRRSPPRRPGCSATSRRRTCARAGNPNGKQVSIVREVSSL